MSVQLLHDDPFPDKADTGLHLIGILAAETVHKDGLDEVDLAKAPAFSYGTGGGNCAYSEKSGNEVADTAWA